MCKMCIDESDTNIIRFHLVAIVPKATFTLKFSSKLLSALHLRDSIVIPCMLHLLSLITKLTPNKMYARRTRRFSIEIM